jgi:hypothetical protein
MLCRNESVSRRCKNRRVVPVSQGSLAFDVFLSYHSGDGEWVAALKSKLESSGIRVWLDTEQIRPGDLFPGALARAIGAVRCVVIVLSPGSVASAWVEEEYNLALAHRRHVIAALIEDVEPPGFLAGRTWVDFRDEGEFQAGLDQLIFGRHHGKAPDTHRVAGGRLSQCDGRRHHRRSRSAEAIDCTAATRGAPLLGSSCAERARRSGHWRRLLRRRHRREYDGSPRRWRPLALDSLVYCVGHDCDRAHTVGQQGRAVRAAARRTGSVPLTLASRLQAPAAALLGHDGARRGRRELASGLTPQFTRVEDRGIGMIRIVWAKRGTL